MRVCVCDRYGQQNACWLSVDEGTIWAFLVPVILVVAINFVLFAIIMKKVMSVRLPSNSNSKDEKTSQTRQLAKRRFGFVIPLFKDCSLQR